MDWFLYDRDLRHGRVKDFVLVIRGGSRAAATSKIECFMIIINGFLPLTIIRKGSILDVAAGLDPPLITRINSRPRSASDYCI